MQASRDRCRSPILEVIIVGPFRFEWRGAGGKIGFDHIGEDGARLGEVEGRDSGVHLIERLAPPQQFGVDCADVVEHLAHFAEVGEELAHFRTGGVRHIAHPRPLPGGADR